MGAAQSLLPTALSLAIVAALVASTVRAFFGEPPNRRWLPVAPLAVGAAVVLLAAVVVGLNFGRADVAALLAAVGTECACAAGWISRFEDHRGGDEPDEDDCGPPSPPVDWDALERELRARAGTARQEAPRPRELATID